MISLPSITTQFRALFKSGDFFVSPQRAILSATNTVTLIDEIDTSHALTQPTQTAQFPLPTADASFNGRPYIRMADTYASNQNLTSTRAASYWIPWISGSGCTLVDVYEFTVSPSFGVCLSVGSGTTVRMQHALNASGAFAQVYDDTNTRRVLLNPSTGFGSGAYAYTSRFALGTSSTGRLGRAPAQTATFTAGTFSATPIRGMGIQACQRKWAASFGFARILTATEEEIARQYVQATYGVTT